MAYALKYFCNFDRVANTGSIYYSLEIYQKDYAGSSTAITGGASAVVHRWDTDEPKAPIKGSSLSITFVNESGSVSIQDLYSTDDEEFLVVLRWGVITMFEGFIVQDDTSEPMVDFTHEITISATDNLGLLKDVPFNEAAFQEYYLFATDTVSVTGLAPHQIVVPTAIGLTIEPGDRLVLTASSINGTYNVTGVFGTGFSRLIEVVEPVATVVAASATIAHYKQDFYSLRTLLSYIHSGLSSTGLTLNTNVFANINETTQSNTDCFLEQVLLDPQTFLKSGNDYDDCYTVLEKILTRFNLTLFQAKGRWNIVRWDEIRYYDYSVPGFAYDSDFAPLTAVNLDGGFTKLLAGIAEATQAETGLSQRISRPFKFTKETFNYHQPVQILRNFDLQQLGALITTYTTGSGSSLQTFKEYEVPWWFIVAGTFTGTANFFIRVVTDSVANEIDRTLVLANGDIASYQIEAAAGDSFTFSFNVITSDSEPGNQNRIFEVKITDGTTTKYLKEDGLWYSTRGWTVNIPSGENTNESHSYSFEGTKIPFDGILTMGLSEYTGGTAETQYRDIRLDYIPTINESTKIIGHTHTSTQATKTKNKEEHELFVDNSPRNSIAGTFFLSSLTGLLQDRAKQWNRKTVTESKNLGDIITFENLFLRRIPRTLIEGTFYGLQSAAGDHISLLNVLRYTFFTDKNFIWGRLEIDYRNNHASGTLFEFYTDTEVDGDLSELYSFGYLYASK